MTMSTASTPRRDWAVKQLGNLRGDSRQRACVARLRGGVLQLDLNGYVGSSDNGKRSFCASAIGQELAKRPRVEHIEVSINSFGGSHAEGVKIFNALRKHPAFITTIADQNCQSAAMLIFMAGDLRMVWPGTNLLLHRSEVSRAALDEKHLRWTAQTHRLVAQALEQSDQESLEIFASRAGCNRSLVAREMRSETKLPHGVGKAWGIFHCYVGEERWINGRPYHG